MRNSEMVARPQRRFKKTTDSAHTLPLAPDLVQRYFTAAAPDQVWVADVTYIWTREGWLYLRSHRRHLRESGRGLVDQ